MAVTELTLSYFRVCSISDDPEVIEEDQTK